MDRNQLNSIAHFVQGSDEEVAAPLNITFSADLDDTTNRFDLLDAMSNPFRKSPWTVGGLSFANTNGTSFLFNGSGAAVSTPLPYDVIHDRVDVVVNWRGNQPGTNDIVYAWREVYFAPGQVQIVESDVAVRIQATGWCYGGISQLSVFSGGSAV